MCNMIMWTVTSALVILCMLPSSGAFTPPRYGPLLATETMRPMGSRQPLIRSTPSLFCESNLPGVGKTSRRRRNAPSLNLVPFSEVWDGNDGGGVGNTAGKPFASLLPQLGCSALNSEGMLVHSADGENRRYRLYIATDVDDLPPIAKLALDVFDASAITLSTSSDWSELERAVLGVLVEPTIGLYNAYAQAVGYTEVLSGLNKRMRNRMSGDGDDDTDWLAPLFAPEPTPGDPANKRESSLEDMAARSSMILALARKAEESTGEMEVAASIELRLQPTDAKIPFSQPWLDKLERGLVRLMPFAVGGSSPVVARDKSSMPEDATVANMGEGGESPPLRPYLCNLCVSPALRSMGIGRALCRVVESVARHRWGYSHVYLHVDPENDAARGLYEKEGYVDVGRRWNAVWAGGAEGISYCVKRLE